MLELLVPVVELLASVLEPLPSVLAPDVAVCVEVDPCAEVAPGLEVALAWEVAPDPWVELDKVTVLVAPVLAEDVPAAWLVAPEPPDAVCALLEPAPLVPDELELLDELPPLDVHPCATASSPPTHTHATRVLPKTSPRMFGC